MAKKSPAKSNGKTLSQPNKLPRLSKDQRINKRPLLHPPIAGPRTNASTQKIVYISASSPFISSVKRVRKLLAHIESRSTGHISFAQRNERAILKAIEDGVKDKGEGRRGRGEEVMMQATGKAVENLLSLALWFQGQEDVRVILRTGSVGAVDDISTEGGNTEEESRVRRTSSLECGCFAALRGGQRQDIAGLLYVGVHLCCIEVRLLGALRMKIIAGRYITDTESSRGGLLDSISKS